MHQDLTKICNWVLNDVNLLTTVFIVDFIFEFMGEVLSLANGIFHNVLNFGSFLVVH